MNHINRHIWGAALRASCAPIALVLVLLLAPSTEAQIYTCKAKDGTRIFSDERCGPDAKVVPNISTQSTAKKTPTPKPKIEPRSAAELDELLKKCNAGDMPSCTMWTRAGGPNSLREKERKAEQGCEAGSLADCEYRYCNGGVNDDCRAHVLQAAKVAGDNWYLRNTGKPQADGSTVYEVRCVPAGAHVMRDLSVSCSAIAGPNRCSSGTGSTGFARLDTAAVKLCATK
jgi:hypothetical protein